MPKWRDRGSASDYTGRKSVRVHEDRGWGVSPWRNWRLGARGPVGLSKQVNLFNPVVRDFIAGTSAAVTATRRPSLV